MTARSVPLLSTTPVLRDDSNRNRVHQTVSPFRRMEFAVSFLLYPIDRDWAADGLSVRPENGLPVDEVMERALSRSGAFCPSAEHCAYEICQILGCQGQLGPGPSG